MGVNPGKGAPDARRRAWRDRLALAFVASLVFPGALACGPAREAARPTVSLRMRGTPSDAVVIIDEQALGTLELVAAHGVALPPGIHHVTVKAAGYFPWDREIDAKLGSGPMRLDVALTPVPD